MSNNFINQISNSNQSDRRQHHVTHTNRLTVFCWVRAEAISGERAGRQLNPSLRLLLDRWQPARTGAVVHGSWGTYEIESRYQATTG
jgi:hypothetical protein